MNSVKFNLNGIIDLHVHSWPDIRKRAYTDFQLMEAGVKIGARAIVIKSHHGTTMNRASLVNEHNKILYNGNNNLTVFGGIVLNYAVGGINPVAVETALKLGAKIVWLPTISAENHMKKYGKTGGISCIINGEVIPELIEVLNLIKEYDVILATGHLSPEEIFIVVKKAKEMGINKILINHPEFWVVGLTEEQQIELVKTYDVYLERCFAQPLGNGIYKSNLKDNYNIIKKIGSKNIIVDTDGGQVENPNWEIAFEEYVTYLYNKGITIEELDIMTKVNAAKLLGI